MEMNEMNHIASIIHPIEEQNDELEDRDDDDKNTCLIEICRLCGKKTNNYVPIFDKNVHIFEKIEKCLPIKVSLDDELPLNICKRCFHYLNISYKLIVNCVKVDVLLREKLKKNKNEFKCSNQTGKAPIGLQKTKPVTKNSPMICEMCNSLFLDTKSFDKHIEKVHLNKSLLDLEETNVQTNQNSNNDDVNVMDLIVENEHKRDRENLIVSELIAQNGINIVVQEPVEKVKKVQSKSLPNIIRSRNEPSTKYMVTNNNNSPIKLISAMPLNVSLNNPAYVSMASAAPSAKLIPISPKLQTASNSSNVQLLSNNVSNTTASPKIKILSTPVTTSVAPSTIQILPNNVTSTIQMLPNSIMTLTNNGLSSSSVNANPGAATLSVLPSTLQFIPTNVSPTSHIAIPINAKVAIPRITPNNLGKEIKSKARRGPKPKKQNIKIAISKTNEQEDHNYTNNDDNHNNVDNNDSDDSCNLPLQDTPNAYSSTCAYDVQCDICGIGVDDDELLVSHKKIHLPQKMGCKVCHQECDSLYELYMHKKNKHNVYKRVSLKFSCEQCGKFFTNSWQWENHEEHKCKKKFPSYPCKYCEMGFSTNLKLKRHLRKHKKEMLEDPDVQVFTCIACPKVFVDEEFYQKHRNVHDPECWDKHKCNLCNRSFRDNVRLKEHQQSIHEGIKPHQCDVCGRTFHRRSNMKVHREKHFARKCEYCDESFLKLSGLISHIKQIHQVEPNRQLLAKKQYKSGCYVCRFCGKKLSTYQSVLDHERIHTGEKPHECKTCGKSFRTYTARWAHVQRHKKGSFTCEHCGKVFSYKQNLFTHILIHMPVEERKHQCLKCGKKFLRKGHLNVHMRIHNGERPYTCDICNYSFTQMGDMKRHRARHSSNYTKTRKSRIKIINATSKNESENFTETQLNPDSDHSEDSESFRNFEIIEEHKEFNEQSYMNNADENGDVQNIEIEEINDELEYQINFIMNTVEPAEEIVIHERDC